MNSHSKLEIEKKYSFKGDLELQLKKFNSTEGQAIEIIDEYFDTDDYFFTRKDYWLRYRQVVKSEKTWELKYPTKTRSPGFCKYFETSDQNEITTLLSKILNIELESCNVEELIQSLKLKIFAKFTTTRKTFILDEIKIDLDQTDFGYKLAEFEIVLDADSSQEIIQQSIEKIKNLAEKLGKNNFLSKILFNNHY